MKRRNDIWAVTTIFHAGMNPVRQTAYYLMQNRLDRQGVGLVAVEIAIGDSPFILKEGRDADILLQLRTNSYFWHKETGFNLGAKLLPNSCKYVVLIDADVMFEKDSWPDDVIAALKEYPIIQPYKRIDCLDKDYRISGHIDGYVWAYIHEPTKIAKKCPGMIWAVRKSLFDEGVGFYDRDPIGNADRIFADTVCGDKPSGCSAFRTTAMINDSDAWGDNLWQYMGNHCEHLTPAIYLPLEVIHAWHDSPKYRMYVARHAIPLLYAFNPDKDLEKEYSSGLWKVDKDGCLEGALRILTKFREAPKTPEHDEEFAKYYTSLCAVWEGQAERMIRCQPELEQYRPFIKAPAWETFNMVEGLRKQTKERLGIK